jgi:tektin-3
MMLSITHSKSYDSLYDGFSCCCNLYRLVDEVYEIGDTIEQLRAKLADAEDSMQRLLGTKGSLELDLAVKNNSIYIDREQCMGLRKSYVMAPRTVCCH